MEAAGAAIRHFRSPGSTFDWSCETYLKTGRMMPDDGLEQLRPFDAIFLGAVGYPRRARPRFALGPADSDSPRISAVCESASGAVAARASNRPFKNSARPDRLLRRARKQRRRVFEHRRTDLQPAPRKRSAVQQTVFTRRGCDRIMRYAFELARDAREARDLGDEVERNHLHDAVLGRALRGDGEGISRCPHAISITSTF